MTRTDQKCVELPPRCWDFTPDLLRRYGVVNDADLTAHAEAELFRNKELGEEFAILNRLSSEQKQAMVEALKERHVGIWGIYASI